jgi:hypothetical protein
VTPPALGDRGPARWLVALGLAALAIGCGEADETHTLKPIVLGMSSSLGPSYDDGDLVIYEAKLPVRLPILRPHTAALKSLQATNVPPYGRMPWLQKDEVALQVSWTLTNLDPDPHAVEILIDPWNEFVRYWPGIAVTDVAREQFLPNLSGIDVMLELPGTSSGSASRRFGTFTFQDMDELAIDLATVMSILDSGPAPDPDNPDQDPRVMLVNHAFAVENRSFHDPLIAPYIPDLIAGLIGFDLGLRSYAPANLAIEIVVELLDRGSGKVLSRDDEGETLPVPTAFITAGYGG